MSVDPLNLFIKLNTDKNNFISKEEIKSYENSSIFDSYFKNGKGVDIETFKSTLAFNKVQSIQKESPFEIQRKVPFVGFKVKTIQNENEIPTIHTSKKDLRALDASGADLSNQNYLNFSYDTHTVFPEKDKLPEGFDPQKALENGKNPGLGIRELQKLGYTGKGINVAVIDMQGSVEHSEYKDRVINYSEFGVEKDSGSEGHPFATTSILAGKTCGIASDSNVALYAFNPVENGKPTNKFVIQSLEKIYDTNTKLDSKEKIQVVSLSWGPNMQDTDYNKFLETVKKLEDSGVYVQYNDGDSPNPKLKFSGLARDNMKNPDDIASYKLSDVYAKGENALVGDGGNTLLIPAGNRTTAAPTGENDFVTSAAGGASWQVPYIAGIYTLAKQANSELTPDEFRKIAMETGTPYNNQKGELVGKIVNPKRIIEAVEKLKQGK